ncbi:MAG: hypothetical protein FWD94_03345 [Treponema sp.]|nr:hypothetical protein [Treponema sp.]
MYATLVATAGKLDLKLHQLGIVLKMICNIILGILVRTENVRGKILPDCFGHKLGIGKTPVLGIEFREGKPENDKTVIFQQCIKILCVLLDNADIGFFIGCRDSVNQFP